MENCWQRVKSHSDSDFYHYELDVDLLKETDIEMYNFLNQSIEPINVTKIKTNADEETLNLWRQQAKDNGFDFKTKRRLKC